MAGRGVVYWGRDECDGGGWVVHLVSGDAGDWGASDPGQRHQHRRSLAGPADLGVGAAHGPAARPSVLGGVGGALVLLHTGQVTFMHLVPWLLLVASLLFWISGPAGRWLHERAEDPGVPRQPALLPLFLVLFPVCFYIGYFGAGAGFLIMSALALFGVEEMNALNSLKVTAACLSNLSAVVTFIAGGAIVWHYCVVSMVFAAIGGYAGAQYARRMNADVLRTVVVVIGCAMAAYFFWRQA